MKKLGLIQILILGFVVGCADTGKEFSSSSIDVVQQSYSVNQSTIRKKVDILFVVDNSASMVQDQAVVGAQFKNFISNIADSDYRVGFINTDVSSRGYENREGFFGNLRRVGNSGKKYIDAKSTNPEKLFSDAINYQEAAPCPGGGQCHEEPMRAVMMALSKRETTNSEFFREDANFVSVIITDEDEYSVGENHALQPLQLVKFLMNENNDSLDNLSMFIIAIPPNDLKCYEDQKKASYSGSGAYPAKLLWSLTNYIDGFNVSICNPNLGREMARISDYVKSQLLLKQVTLNPPPVDLKSIQVRITDKKGNLLDIDWKVTSKNVIVFNPIPPADSKIDITYDRKK